MPDAAESTQVLRSFGPTDAVAEPKSVEWHGDGWRVQFKKGNILVRLIGMFPENVTLFDLDPGDVPRQGMVIRMKIKAEGRSNEFKVIAILTKKNTEQCYFIMSKPVNSSGEWVTLESLPASSDEMRGANQLILSVAATKFGNALVKDLQIIM